MPRFSLQDIPKQPGVYIFRNSTGDVIYVGKAKSLRKRMATYFQPSRSQRADVKLRALINSIDAYEIRTVNSEAEALLLESQLIKKYAPRYNVDLRDDKRFLHICVDLREPYPRLMLVRLRKDDGRLYFGPFPRARVLRETVHFLSARFRLRNCRPRRPDESTRRHCLDHVIRHCCGPCLGNVSEDNYHARVREVIDVLQGDTAAILQELDGKMQKASEQHEFEEAARWRDMGDNLRFVCIKGRRTFAKASLEGDREALGERGVLALKEALGLTCAPNVVECFDISNIGGRHVVGSLVQFVRGRPHRRSYRRFRIRSSEAVDDTARMHEVITRRYSRLLAEEAPLPDLVVVDGGRGQLNAAIEAFAQSGAPPIPFLSLAKKREEVYLPGRADPVLLPRHHDGLKLLQAVRDEAHRFALTYHRSLRQRRIADSVLGEIEGIGEKRRQQLLRAFGSVRRLRDATPEDIAAAVPGLGRHLAEKILLYLQNSP